MKKAESKVTEAVQHQQAVEAARMATNNLTSGSIFGGKKKTYSWLKNPTPTTPRSGLATPSKALGAQSTPSSTGKAGASPTTANKVTHLGDWREDEKQRSIQIRDILFMLEVDGKGIKHLQKAYSKESKEELDKQTR